MNTMLRLEPAATGMSERTAAGPRPVGPAHRDGVNQWI